MCPLFQSGRTGLRAYAIMIAGVPGNADRSDDLSVHDQRDPTFERHGPRQPKDAKTRASTGH